MAEEITKEKLEKIIKLAEELERASPRESLRISKELGEEAEGLTK